jgi:hypothetical protein
VKAITLKHPWPWAVAVLGKRIENRKWLPSPRQLKVDDYLAIHGGKWPTSGSDLDDVMCEATDLAFAHRDKLPGGNPTLLDVAKFSGIVAVCRFGGAVTDSPNPWFEGPYGWVLGSVVVLPRPVICKGAQGLWDIPEEVLTEVRHEYALARLEAARG